VPQRQSVKPWLDALSRPAIPNRLKDPYMIRDDIKAAQLTAMKAGDKESRNAISLIQAAIKNRDIEARTGKRPKATTRW